MRSTTKFDFIFSTRTLRKVAPRVTIHVFNKTFQAFKNILLVIYANKARIMVVKTQSGKLHTNVVGNFNPMIEVNEKRMLLGKSMIK